MHLRGTAYEFNHPQTRLAGATIRVAEFPRLRAVVRANGSYDLAVPNRVRVTPYIVASGYHTIYLQTLTTAGGDFNNVNFQTPPDSVYHALAAYLKVPLDAHGNPVQCAIVSTFSTRYVRDLSFAQFGKYGAHGVAGATASVTPRLPTPTYFDEYVIPDPNQTTSSQDGGVIWTKVPSGIYTIRAHDPHTHFASFVATCKPGRVINANPPWGLHQLAPNSPANAMWSFLLSQSSTMLASLKVVALPAHALVGLLCSGTSCPFKARSFKPARASFDVVRALGKHSISFGGGDTFDVTASAHAYNAVVYRWKFHNGRSPALMKLCIPDGDTVPLAHC